jgi:hypothetical protein
MGQSAHSGEYLSAAGAEKIGTGDIKLGTGDIRVAAGERTTSPALSKLSQIDHM